MSVSAQKGRRGCESRRTCVCTAKRCTEFFSTGFDSSYTNMRGIRCFFELDALRERLPSDLAMVAEGEVVRAASDEEMLDMPVEADQLMGIGAEARVVDDPAMGDIGAMGLKRRLVLPLDPRRGLVERELERVTEAELPVLPERSC